MAEAADVVQLHELPSARAAREALAGKDPRGGRWLGVGSGMGLTGVSGLAVGVRVLGTVNPVVTVSPLGTLDVTVRANLLPTRWAPQIGVGHVLGYRGDLVASGEACPFTHVDVGAEFVPVGSFTFTTGLTVADADCTGRFLPVPLPYIGTAWYFGR